MTRPVLVPHFFTEGSRRYILNLPDVYAKSGYTIGSAMGITKAPANFEPEDDDIGLLVSEGLKTGKLIRIRISYRDTSSTPNKTKSARIVCPVSKADTALASLKSKTYDAFNITGAGVPRRRRLG